MSIPPEWDRRALSLVFCTYSFGRQGGGAEQQASLQATELVKRGHSVTVVYPGRLRESPQLVDGVALRPIRMLRVPRLSSALYLPLLFLWLLRRRGNCSVIHVHSANDHLLAALAAGRLLRVPVYCKLASYGTYGELKAGASWRGRLRLWALRRASVIQATSTPVAEELRSLGVREELVARLPNGVDTDLFAPLELSERQALRAGQDLPLDAMVFLYAGRFADYKGVRDLLAAWRQCNLGEAILVLLGAGHETEQAVEVESGATPGVRVVPWTADIRPYMQAADVFVLPSHVEGMSNALLEAMACGLAPVVTCVGGATDLIHEGKNGLLVTPRDPTQLAHALKKLSSDFETVRRLGAASRATVVSACSISAVVDGLEFRYLQA